MCKVELRLIETDTPGSGRIRKTEFQLYTLAYFSERFSPDCFISPQVTVRLTLGDADTEYAIMGSDQAGFFSLAG